MATVVDHLITKYSLDESDYVAGTKVVDRATSGLRGSFGRAVSGAKELGPAFSQVGTVLRNGALAIGAVGVAAGAAAFSSMQAAAEFDRMGATFAGAFGSMDAGVQMMKYLEQYATKSAFSLEALASAATTLAAGGMDVGRFLPMIEKFALVISGVDPSGLQQVAGALLRAKGGAFGEAMESFRRAGISTNDFKSAGVKVSKGGEIQATSDEFLRALEKMVRRIDPIAESVSESDAVVLSNVFDALGRAWRQIGTAFNTEFLDDVKAFGDQVAFLAEAGVFTDIAQGFASLTASLTGAGSMEQAVDAVAISLLAIPIAVRHIGDTLEWLDKLFNPLGRKVRGGLKAAMDSASGGSYSKAVEDFYGITEARANLEARKAEARSKTRQAFEAPKPKDQEQAAVVAQAFAPATNYLRDIADNTRKSLDLAKIGLGANIGKYGVSAVELSDMKAGRTAGYGKWTKVIRALEEVMGEAAAESIATAQRRRTPFVAGG